MLFNSVSIKFNTFPRGYTFLDYYKLKLYFYLFLKKTPTLKNTLDFYDVYLLVLGRSLIFCNCFFYHWFYFYYSVIYRGFFFFDVHTKSMEGFYKLKFKNFDYTIPNSVSSLTTLPCVIIYISFFFNLRNKFISKLFLSHLFLNV